MNDVTTKQIQLEHADIRYREWVGKKLNSKRGLNYEARQYFLDILKFPPLSGQIRIGVSTLAKRIVTLKWLIKGKKWVQYEKNPHQWRMDV